MILVGYAARDTLRRDAPNWRYVLLELYHHGSSVCAAKVRFALEEKGLEWTGHYVDILKGEQFTSEYQSINPKAVVPALVHDGSVITESTVICEYIEDQWPERALMPASPTLRAHVRYWTKAVDEDLHPACGAITFMISHRHTIARLGAQEMKAFLDATPDHSAFTNWKSEKRRFVELGLDAPGAKEKLELYAEYLKKMDRALASTPWLVGESFSLADISLAPYVNRLAAMSMDGLWRDGALRNLERWFNAISARPTFARAFTEWMPPTLTEELAQNGRRSWPEVQALLYT